MKNIHILPTNKPTRLHFDDKLFISRNPQISKEINSIVVGRYIYITFDEEIKEGDWFYLDMSHSNTLPDEIHQMGNDKWSKTGGIHFCEGNTWVDSCKKIILTTDQDLINDGVQAIDDEFLEWFVKNPSCEEVEIGEGVRYEDEWIDNEDGGEIFQHQYCCYKTIIPKEEPTISDEAKQRAKNYMSLKGALEPKQETLETAAEIWINNRFTKQICGDKSYPDIYASKKSIIESHIIFAKSQGKIMYSEEEVLELLQKALTHKDNGETGNLITAQGEIRTANFFSWFKQFKKK